MATQRFSNAPTERQLGLVVSPRSMEQTVSELLSSTTRSAISLRAGWHEPYEYCSTQDAYPAVSPAEYLTRPPQEKP